MTEKRFGSLKLRITSGHLRLWKDAPFLVMMLAIFMRWTLKMEKPSGKPRRRIRWLRYWPHITSWFITAEGEIACTRWTRSQARRSGYIEQKNHVLRQWRRMG